MTTGKYNKYWTIREWAQMNKMYNTVKLLEMKLVNQHETSHHVQHSTKKQVTMSKLHAYKYTVKGTNSLLSCTKV